MIILFWAFFFLFVSLSPFLSLCLSILSLFSPTYLRLFFSTFVPVLVSVIFYISLYHSMHCLQSLFVFFFCKFLFLLSLFDGFDVTRSRMKSSEKKKKEGNLLDNTQSLQSDWSLDVKLAQEIPNKPPGMFLSLLYCQYY